MNRLGLFLAVLVPACAVLVGCSEPPPPPPAAAPVPPAREQIYVVVARGQSLDSIAKSYHVKKAEIVALNKLSPPYKLKPGTVLTLPAGAVETPPHKEKAKAPAKPKVAEAPPEHRAPRPTRPKRPPPEVIPLD